MGDLRAETDSVEGDWKDFEFRVITKADYPAIEEQVKNVFCRGEPTFELIGYSAELANDMWKLVKLGLDKNNQLSFYAVHKPTQKLAGVRVTYRCEKNEKDPEIEHESLVTSHDFHNIFEVEVEGNICERYGVEYYAELLVASVDPEFRNQGLATEMYRRTFLLLRSKGYPAAQCFFTSPITRKVANKMGFEEIGRRYFKDFRSPEGIKFLENAADDQFGALMAIKL